MKTAVVTGASGFIGSALVKTLVDSGVEVYAVGRNVDLMQQNKMLVGARCIYADFDDGFNINESISAKIDCFFHCAFAGGFSSQAIKNYELQLLNVKYACDAVQSAVDMDVKKFVYVSTVNTVEIYTFIEREDFMPRYTCIYGSAKLLAELIGKTIAKNNDMKFCTALIAMPYGENNNANTLPNIIIEQLLQGIRPKLIEGNNLYDLIYIDDVVAGLQAIGESGVDFRNYYIGHRKLENFKNWIITIRDIIAPNIDLEFGEYADTPSVDYSKIDLDMLYRDTGFECKADFKDSILKTAGWLKKQIRTKVPGGGRQT